MSMSIFSVTKGGYELSLVLSSIYSNASIYASKKFGKAPHRLIDGNFKECVEEAFKKDDAIIFIMAAGIVVRSIAPHIKSKLEDPAVIVMDEKGNNVISLLSGHIGGGNAIALEIAQSISANPVITTASDVQDKIAVDLLAIKNDLVIDAMKDATTFASCVVNGEALVMKTDGVVKCHLDNQWTLNPLRIKEDDKLLYISNKSTKEHKTLWLIPRNIVIGVGCRRGTEKIKLLGAIEKSLSALSLDPRSVKKISTVDVKADEVGLIATANELNLPLEIINREAIALIQDEFEGSDFVEKTIGVRAVAEPVAKISSNRAGKFLMGKTAYDGITIAIWEEEYEIR